MCNQTIKIFTRCYLNNCNMYHLYTRNMIKHPILLIIGNILLVNISFKMYRIRCVYTLNFARVIIIFRFYSMFNFYFIQLSCASYILITYRVSESDSSCLTTSDLSPNKDDSTIEPRVPVSVKLKKLLQDVEVQSKYNSFFSLLNI